MKTALVAVILSLWSAPALAADPAMTFFVTSRGGPAGANLGGLAGADRLCQTLAAAAGAGDKTWRAYLSASPREGRAAIHARDRIGRGPWINARGRVVARDLAELHGDANAIDRHTALTERGAPVPGGQHDVLTGSDDQGRLAFSEDGLPATCADWTSAGDGIARIGHADRLDSASWGNERFPRWSGSWGSEHDTVGCGARRLADTGGGGRLYCFAPGSAPTAAAPASRSGATFRRGLVVDPGLDEEDVAWVAAQGFDHLNIRVDGGAWLTRQGELDGAALAPFERALARARARGLGVVLSMVGLPGLPAARRPRSPAGPSSPLADETTRGDAAYLWWAIARRYAGEGDALRFELLHRPDAGEPAAMSAFNQLCLRAVRRLSPARVVYLTAHDMSLDAAVTVALPDVHTALAVALPGPRGPVDPALVDARLDAFAARARRHAPGREIYVASLGVPARGGDAAAGRTLRAARSALERNRLSWALSDGRGRRAIRDPRGRATRALEALDLPRPGAAVGYRRKLRGSSR